MSDEVVLPGAADEQGFKPTFEITREDARGKFITIADESDFSGWYRHIFVTPQEDKRGPDKVKAPFHKVVFNLIVHEPNVQNKETKGSWKKHLEIDEFNRLADEILSRPYVDSGTREIFKSVGFSGNLGREMTITVMPKKTDPSKMMFSFSISKGEAKSSPSGPGFNYTGPVSRASIMLPEEQARQMVIEMTNHLQAMRTAVLTRGMNVITAPVKF